MRPLERVLLVVCVALVAAGVAGVAVHRAPAGRIGIGTGVTTTTSRPATTGSAPATTAPPATSPGGRPGASSQALAAGLLTPTDLGGFYRVNRPDAAQTLGSAPCLAGLGPSPSQSGTASEGLVGPSGGGLPFVTELVDSYPGSSAAGVYRSVFASLQSCPAFAVDLEGAGERVTIAEGNLAPVGDASSEFEGTFTSGPRQEKLQIGLVLYGQDVVCLLYADTVPPSNAIYGDLPSTLSAAIGKLA